MGVGGETATGSLGTKDPVGVWERIPGRQGTVNVSAPGVRISSGSAARCWSASSVRLVLADQDGRETHGGTMTVVAGIIALLLLGYLIVALLNPEKF